MMLRALIIMVLVAQGLFSFAAPVPVSEMSHSPESMDSMAMQDCHDSMELVDASADMNSEHCTQQCCCPGVCGGVAVLPAAFYPPIQLHSLKPVARAVMARAAEVSPLYRPPIHA
ncbi:hypothetical protein [Gilvimarinus xylanilyticus]|uniref:CopL family metal-binding regulatory protein n=1 Tax=Gilvimarinus xylanilyticus TaxID=2944139 RepID=A0A9X2I3D2_9GAMM|nr:hypothetical protein [Gilvimarinus xylanilyticus]MCP8899256.1 hypothetical protein [Gilvimarinus xylanilyticus]